MAEFLQEDLLQISSVLHEPKREELKHRQIFRLNTEYAAFAQEIGYDVYNRTGSAKILAAGANAKDIPFVGGEKERFSQQVYTIVSGINFTQAERDATAAQRAFGKGPAVNLDSLRVATARRYMRELEHKICFVGEPTYGIKGILDSTFYGAGKGTKEAVANPGAGTAWSLKTPDEIIEDLNRARRVVENGGFFKARVLVIPDIQWNLLKKPYSATSPMTIIKWLESEGQYFEQIIVTNAMDSTNSGEGSDIMLVLDNQPEVVELATPRDMMLGDPIFNILGDSEQAATIRTGGLMVRHTIALYVGTGI